MTVVADNLPGYMQYLDLIRDCIKLLSLEPLPPNKVETQHVFGGLGGFSYAYAGEDNRHHRKHGKSEKFDLTERNRWLNQGRKRRNKKRQRLLESQGSSEMDSSSQLPKKTAGLERTKLQPAGCPRQELERGGSESG